MQIFYITDTAVLIIPFLKVTPQNNKKKLNTKLENDTRQLFSISSGSPINKQKPSALQGIISTLDLYRAPPPLEIANYLE